MPNVPHDIVPAAVLLLSAYSLLKLAFFALPYEKRRAALDKSYDKKAYATGTADIVFLGIAVALAAALLASGGAPISFLGGLFVGAVLIQLFFHAFHAAVPPGREAPEPRSPLKQMSYAIQDRPQRAYRDADQARHQIGSFIDEVYNRQRLHSALDYLPPEEYEAKLPKLIRAVPPGSALLTENRP